MKTILVAGLLGAVLAAGCNRTANERTGSRRVEIQLTEKGFEPAEVSVKAGEPVTLVVTRKTENTCAKEIVVASIGMRRDLPLNQPVEVAFTPERAGEIRYACGMDMITGRIVVR